MFSCETQHKRKHMQYTTAATNNARAAGGTVVRQGRVSYLLKLERKIFEYLISIGIPTAT